MNCCDDYGVCRQGHGCPARSTRWPETTRTANAAACKSDAGKSFDAPARKAYALYRSRVAALSHTVKPLPVWADLGSELQAAWTAAVEQMFNDFRALH